MDVDPTAAKEAGDPTAPVIVYGFPSTISPERTGGDFRPLIPPPAPLAWYDRVLLWLVVKTMRGISRTPGDGKV